MLVVLRGRAAFLLLPVVRCPLSLLAAALTLASVTSLAALLWPTSPAGAISLPGIPTALAVDAAAHRLYVTTYPGTIGSTVWTLGGDASRLLGNVSLGERFPVALAVNAANGHVYVAEAPDRLTVLSGATNTKLASFDLDGSPVGIAINTAANRVY